MWKPLNSSESEPHDTVASQTQVVAMSAESRCCSARFPSLFESLSSDLGLAMFVPYEALGSVIGSLIAQFARSSSCMLHAAEGRKAEVRGRGRGKNKNKQEREHSRQNPSTVAIDDRRTQEAATSRTGNSNQRQFVNCQRARHANTKKLKVQKQN